MSRPAARSRRWAAEQLPHPSPDLRPSDRDTPQLGRADLVQSSPDGGVRSNRPEHLTLVPQHVDVTQRFTAIGGQYGQIDQDPTPIMARERPGPRKRDRQGAGQPGPIREHPQQRRADVRHHTRGVTARCVDRDKV